MTGHGAAGPDAISRRAAVELATELYRALAAGDRDGLGRLLDPGFAGHATEGLPLDLGGSYRGPEEMRRQFWWRIGRSFTARAEPDEFSLLDDGRLLVHGRYKGEATATGEPLDAEFVHLLSFADGRITGLVQVTDSARWARALAGDGTVNTVGNVHDAVRFTLSDGIAEIRLNRPDVRNALNQAAADALHEAALRCATTPGVRAVLIAGNGPAFTVGGDIAAFAEADPAELPLVLRRMITPYHEALRVLAGLEIPVVAAVHGAVAGGGLGLLYVADIALAAEGTKFATAFAGIGLSGDGGNSWFLPRLVGPRRAAELYFEQRVLDASEAAEWGLVTRVIAPGALDDEARAVARRLAAGPTRAFGEIRRLLRESWSATLPGQLEAEADAIRRTSASSDAREAIAAFLAKQAPVFEGR